MGFSMEHLKAVTDAVKRVARTYTGEHWDKGGYFRLYRMPDSKCLYFDLVPVWSGWIGGESNKQKEEKYKIISMEKAIRLATMHRKFGHLSSWASRNPDEGLYGGAICLEFVGAHSEVTPNQPETYIFSFSGLPEYGDEAAMLEAAHTMGGWLYRIEQVREIMTTSRNVLAAKFLEMTI